MTAKRLKPIAAFVSIIFLFCLTFSISLAQEGGTVEGFDDESLPGWEHSEGTSVVDGALQVQPENFALRFYDYTSQIYGFDFKKSGSGVLIFRYAIGEGGEYGLIIHDEGIILEHATEEGPIYLGESAWEAPTDDWQTVEISLGPDAHQVTLDGSTLLTTEETEFLSGGGVGFWVEGETTVEVDNLTVGKAPEVGEEVGGEAPPEHPPEEPVPSPAAATDTSSGSLSFDDLIAEFTTVQASPTQLGTFLANLALSVVLSYILSRVYVHWGSSLSNRRRFAANFILISVTTTFIILVVRSSVALSLGLVGALSIVRFRSAIKEPEELAYLFFAIGIGIGLGDNQRLITVIALAVAILVLGIMRLFRGRQADFNLHLTVSSDNPGKVELETILDTLKPHCSQMKLMRFDETENGQETSFLVEFRSMDHFKEAKSALRALSESLTITFLDNKGIW
jgi:hypothetical protein